jgi:hypothetical protein
VNTVDNGGRPDGGRGVRAARRRAERVDNSAARARLPACRSSGARGLRWLRDRVPGIVVPDEVVERVERVAAPVQPDACREAAPLELAVRIFERVPSLRGLHVVSFQGPGVAAQLRDVVRAAALRV